jgi:hypothetical protein
VNSKLCFRFGEGMDCCPIACPSFSSSLLSCAQVLFFVNSPWCYLLFKLFSNLFSPCCVFSVLFRERFISTSRSNFSFYYPLCFSGFLPSTSRNVISDLFVCFVHSRYCFRSTPSRRLVTENPATWKNSWIDRIELEIKVWIKLLFCEEQRQPQSRKEKRRYQSTPGKLGEACSYK